MNLRKLLPVLGAVIAAFGPAKGIASKPKRPCLQCGKPHDHNNSYCSADCCQQHRAAKK